VLREHTLRLRMIPAGAPPALAPPALAPPDDRVRNPRTGNSAPDRRSRRKRDTSRSRKGEPARLRKHR
jgi:hypothetical protein